MNTLLLTKTIAPKSTSVINNYVLNKSDTRLDQVIHMINEYRKGKLYECPSELELDKLEAVEQAFLTLADDHGAVTTPREIFSFYIKVRWMMHKYTKELDYIATSLNTYFLLREMFKPR